MSPPSISAGIRSQIATAKSKNRCAIFPVIKLQPKKGYWRCEQSVTFYRFWTCDEKSSALRSGHKDPFTYGTKYALFELQCQSGGYRLICVEG